MKLLQHFQSLALHWQRELLQSTRILDISIAAHT